MASSYGVRVLLLYRRHRVWIPSLQGQVKAAPFCEGAVPQEGERLYAASSIVQIYKRHSTVRSWYRRAHYKFIAFVERTI